MEIRPETAFGDMRSADLMLVQGFPSRVASVARQRGGPNLVCPFTFLPPYLVCSLKPGHFWLGVLNFSSRRKTISR